MTWRMFWKIKGGLDIKALDAPSDVTSLHHSLHIGSNVLPENSCSSVDINQETSSAPKSIRKRKSPAPSKCGSFAAIVIPLTGLTSQEIPPKGPARSVITGNVAIVSASSCTKEGDASGGS